MKDVSLSDESDDERDRVSVHEDCTGDSKGETNNKNQSESDHHKII